MSNTNFGAVEIRGVPVVAARHLGDVYVIRPLVMAILGKNSTVSLEKMIPNAKILRMSDIFASPCKSIHGRTKMVDYRSAIIAVNARKNVPARRIEMLLTEPSTLELLKIAMELPKMTIEVDPVDLGKVDITACLDAPSDNATETNSDSNSDSSSDSSSDSLSSDEASSSDESSVISGETLDYPDEAIDLNADNINEVAHIDIRGLKVLCVRYKSHYYLAKPQLLALIGYPRVIADEFGDDTKAVSASLLSELGILTNESIHPKTKFVEFDYAMCELNRRSPNDATRITKAIAKNSYLQPLSDYATSLPVSPQRPPERIAAMSAIPQNALKRKIEAVKHTTKEPAKKRRKCANIAAKKATKTAAKIGATIVVGLATGRQSKSTGSGDTIAREIREAMDRVKKLQALQQMQERVAALEQEKKKAEALRRELGI